MRLPLATTLRNRTKNTDKDARLLNAVVDTKNRVQKRPSLVATYGPVTAGNGLGLFVRNTPGPELVAITGTIVTVTPSAYANPTHTLVAADFGGGVLGYDNSVPVPFNNLTPNTVNGALCVFFRCIQSNGYTWLRIAGELPQNWFNSVRIGSKTLLSADATYTFSFTEWEWTSLPAIIPSEGTFSVYFD